MDFYYQKGDTQLCNGFWTIFITGKFSVDPVFQPKNWIIHFPTGFVDQTAVQKIIIIQMYEKLIIGDN